MANEQGLPIVLVVDDNTDLRDGMVAWIEDHGFQAVAAANGVEALAYLSRGLRPCLIVLDLRMPEMDGWEVLRRLKGQGELSAIPVVVVSAEEDRPRDVTYFLRKPFDGGALMRIIRSHRT